MRLINLKDITLLIKEAVIEINYKLDNSLVSLIRKAKANETQDLSISILEVTFHYAKILVL